MITSKSPSLNYVATRGDERARELSISARKLAATLWEIDGLPSPRVERESLDDRKSEVGGVVRMLESGSTALVLSDPFLSPLAEVGIVHLHGHTYLIVFTCCCCVSFD